MKISIIIPAYNEEKYLARTLTSIKKLDKDGHNVEILVLDALSTDKTPQIAKKQGARVLRIARKSIGFARQQGIKHARGDIILYTDADTILPKDWIMRHVANLQKPGVVCSCGGFRLTDGSFPFFHFANYLQPILLYLSYKLFYIPFATGQNMAFWKKKALLVGGFDEQIAVMEDTDLAIRMKRVGKVIYQPDIIIYASGRRSNEGWAFFPRMTKAVIQYFILKKRALTGFPDFR